MAARTRSAQASGGLGVAVGDGLGEEAGDGVGLAEGDAHAEVTTIINTRMATSLPRADCALRSARPAPARLRIAGGQRGGSRLLRGGTRRGGRGYGRRTRAAAARGSA